jgi:hypothetical protein
MTQELACAPYAAGPSYVLGFRPERLRPSEPS